MMVLFFMAAALQPAPVDSVHASPRPIKLYFKSWIPETRSLTGGLKKTDLKGTAHAEAIVSPGGMIRRVNLVDGSGVPYLTYDLVWNRERTWSRYQITARIDTSLTILNDLMLAHDLSDLRPGYRVEVRDRRNGDMDMLRVFDELGGFLYYYTFEYDRLSTGGEEIRSRYFKYDSILVGHHQLEYDQRGRLRGIDYFRPDGGLKYSLGYQYNMKNREISRSIIDIDGALLEKRILPFNEKYLRRVRQDKSSISLSEAVNFLENASEKDIDALAQILEQRYRKEISRVDTTYSPIINVTDTLLVEKEVPVVPETALSGNGRKRIFRYSFELGGAVRKGSYFSQGHVLNTGLAVNTVREFRIWFLPRFRPVVAGTFLNYDSRIYPGFKAGLNFPGHLPFRIPFELSGEMGWSGAGPELTGSATVLWSKSLVIGVKTEVSIYPDAFKSGTVTGLVNTKLLIGF